MSTPRLVCSAVLIALIGMSGCRPNSSPPPAGEQALGRPAPRVPAATQPVAGARNSPRFEDDPPAPGTAQALARRAATYAQNLEPMVARRQSRGHSDVAEWPDPDAMGLTPRPADSGAAAGASAPISVMPNTSVNAAPLEKKTVRVQPEAGQASIEGTVIPSPPADSLARKLAQRARDYPQDLSAQLDDELMRLLNDQPVPDIQATAGLAAEDRELLSALMDSLTNFRTALRADNNMLFSRKIRPLVELTDRLRGQAELSVPTVALCKSAHGYGLYDPIDPARFVAGTAHNVVVYCEVENFLSQLDTNKQWETHLTQDIVLYTEASGMEVWKDKKLTYLDRARTRRHDFFIGRVITLPANLTIGSYLLKVTVEDTQAKHIAENTVPVEIVAQ